MKLNKTFAFTALVASSLFVGTALQAEDSTTPPPSGDKPHSGPGGMHGRPNGDTIAKELGLTDDQKAKVKIVLEDQQTQMKALHEDTTLSPADKKAKFMELRKASQAKMKEILTADQYEKWQKHMEHRPMPKGDKAAPGGDNAPKN